MSKAITSKAILITAVLSLLVNCGGGGTNTTPLPPMEQQLDADVQQLPLPVTTPHLLTDEIEPQQAIADMAIGINLGNTFDAPHEGDWALPAQQSFILAFKEAGFKHIRIPVTWDLHTQSAYPYEIEMSFLNRVEQVIDWALAEDLYVIVNAHHESWLKEDFQNQQTRNRFDKIWMQIAAHFKTKPAKLMFEFLNEPNGMTIAGVNQLNKRVLAIIRNENPNRLAIFSGHGFTPIDSLLATEIPDVQDTFLIGNFHSYDPWQFAGQCQQSWGTEQDKSDLRQIYKRASDWAVVHQTPVMVNEFGSAKFDFTQPANVCDLSQRLSYLAEHVSLANEFGIAASFWDDGGSFSSYDRTNNSWGPEKDVLVATPE